ncbi:MAG: DNA polymerase IV [Oligoflexus sp.]
MKDGNLNQSADIHPSLLQRKIIHFDMDAFYASIEVRDRPELRGKPVVVGGSPNSRAVVCTASYEARKFGVRSAMPCSQAARLCPTAVFLPPDFARYREASQKIHSVFRRYTSLIEPLSLDEAYLDVTHNSMGLYAVQIARRIQQEVYAETSLTGSAGVAPNKLLAKIASDIKKPAGITVVLPQNATDFIANLPLRKIHGIGPATERRLAELDLKLCRDVWGFELEALNQLLGPRMATWLYKRSRGLDDRKVETSRQRKSLGQEETFSHDIIDLCVLHGELEKLSEQVANGLNRRGMKGQGVTLKVKYADFKQCTRSYRLPIFTADKDVIFDVVKGLLEKTEAGKRKIRLLGVTLSHFAPQHGGLAI